MLAKGRLLCRFFRWTEKGKRGASRDMFRVTTRGREKRGESFCERVLDRILSGISSGGEGYRRRRRAECEAFFPCDFIRYDSLRNQRELDFSLIILHPIGLSVPTAKLRCAV